MTRVLPLVGCVALACLCAARAQAQGTNPVDRKVENPITDTPNVNPLQQDQPVRPPTGKPPPIQPGDTLTVTCHNETFSGPKEARVSVCEGNVDARIGTYRLQADKVTVYDATNKVIAEGNVVFAAEGAAAMKNFLFMLFLYTLVLSALLRRS